MKKKLLFVGDAGCPSGFARATHEILDTLQEQYDVTVLGVNYRGDPHHYPYPLYAAMAGGDALGVGRLQWMCHRVRPDVIVVQSDGWFVPYYIAKLRERKASGEYVSPEFAAIPVVAAVAVDGKNFQGAWIKDVTHAVFWTQFALNEARLGGYRGPATVIPLGVDTQQFYPVDRNEALARQGYGSQKDFFIVGSVNRNQPRKRWDLTVRYFASWVKSRGVKDAVLMLHSAPTGDNCINIMELARYYDVLDRLNTYTPETFYGKHDDDMRDTYNMIDVWISTSQGEGMGLTAMEAMACGRPCILPDSSAYAEWAKGACALVSCSSTATQVPGLSVIGAVPDEKPFVEALDLLYRDKERRELIAARGLARMQSPEYRWQTIGQQWLGVLESVFAPKEIWQVPQRRLTSETKLQIEKVEGDHKIVVELDGKAIGRAVVEQLPKTVVRLGK